MGGKSMIFAPYVRLYHSLLLSIKIKTLQKILLLNLTEKAIEEN